MGLTFDQLLPYAFALIIALPFFALLKNFVHTYIELKNKELQILSRSHTTGGENISAYERMVVFLERLKPTELFRDFSEDISAAELVILALKKIQMEWDYNASLQLHLSKNAWEQAQYTKIQMEQLLTESMSGLSPNGTATDLKSIVQMSLIQKEDFINNSILHLRRDALQIINQ